MPTTAPTELIILLHLGMGVFWVLTYILIIKRGFQDSALGMPLFALCANISWEFVYAFVLPKPPPDQYINIAWFLLDLVILVQAIRFGAQDLPPSVPRRRFPFVLLLGLLMGGCLVTSIIYEFNWDRHYLAFGLNFMMSALFISMLLRRNSVRGQSIYIALFKMVGTVLPAIMSALLFPGSLLLGFLYVFTFMLDLIYTVALYAKLREAGISPWRRF
jgi:hypothetical protein